MALKGDRNVLETDISFFINVTAEKGQLLCVSTQGSGAAMDNSYSLATTASGTNVPLGIVLNDVVNIDQTRQHINWHKDEVQQGGKVTILTKGTVVTDQITGTPTAGMVAYLNTGGTVGAQAHGESLAVGRFLSTKDADGYAKVAINLP